MKKNSKDAFELGQYRNLQEENVYDTGRGSISLLSHIDEPEEGNYDTGRGSISLLSHIDEPEEGDYDNGREFTFLFNHIERPEEVEYKDRSDRKVDDLSEREYKIGDNVPQDDPESPDGSPDQFHTVIDGRKRQKYKKFTTNDAKGKSNQAKLDYHITQMFLEKHDKEKVFSLMKHNKRPLLLIYNTKEGRYHQYTRDEFPTILAKLVHGTKFEAKMKRQTYYEVFHRLLYHPSLQANLEDFDHDDRYVNVMNGVIDLQEKELLPHDPSYRFLSVIYCPFKTEYAWKGKIPKLFKQMLERHFPCREDRELFLESLAYLISWKHGIKKAFFWIGAPHTGKSTFLRILDSFLGDAVAHHSLKQIASKHGPADLEGARVNVCAEVEKTEIRNLDNFKSLIGNDTISIEPKFQSLRSMKSRIDILLVGNDFMPLAKGVGEPALYDRILPIRFQNPYTEEEKIPLFDETLLKEEGVKIFAVIVRVLFGLFEKGYDFTHSKLSEAEKKRFIRQNTQVSSVDCFIEDRCHATDSAQFSSSRAIYDSYGEYCRNNGFDAMNKTQFFRRFAERFDSKLHRRGIEDSSGQRCRGYFGIEVHGSIVD